MGPEAPRAEHNRASPGFESLKEFLSSAYFRHQRPASSSGHEVVYVSDRKQARVPDAHTTLISGCLFLRNYPPAHCTSVLLRCRRRSATMAVPQPSFTMST
jgi:hypothetical protein